MEPSYHHAIHDGEHMHRHEHHYHDGHEFEYGVMHGDYGHMAYDAVEGGMKKKEAELGSLEPRSDLTTEKDKKAATSKSTSDKSKQSKQVKDDR